MASRVEKSGIWVLGSVLGPGPRWARLRGKVLTGWDLSVLSSSHVNEQGLGDLCAGLGIPDPDGAIAAPRCNVVAVGQEGHTIHLRTQFSFITPI